MHQTQSLINKIRDACKKEWKLVEFITIDETMVRYKDKYCPTKQYMPKIPIKWRLKVWYAIDPNSKFIYDFDVYCGKNMQSIDGQESSRIIANLGYKVVIDFTRGLENKGHVIVMDNFFTSIELFQDLERRGIYKTRTMRSICIGLHPSMKNIKKFKKRPQGDLDWMMHSSRRLSSVIWKDKQRVLLLSTHAPPITNGNAMSFSVPPHNGRERPQIPTSLILVEYTTKM